MCIYIMIFFKPRKTFREIFNFHILKSEKILNKLFEQNF